MQWHEWIWGAGGRGWGECRCSMSVCVGSSQMLILAMDLECNSQSRVSDGGSVLSTSIVRYLRNPGLLRDDLN